MAGQPQEPFGSVLRNLRAQAGLTQEELAEAARLSVRSVSDLERGINLTARRDTARQLADALGLRGDSRERFEATARGRAPRSAIVPASHPAPPFQGLASVRALPRDIASFIARDEEFSHLIEEVTRGAPVNVWAIGGMAGVGKTVFAVHAAHRLAPDFPDGQVFLSLHGHTPGQRPVDPADALASVLLTIGVPAVQIPGDLTARTSMWRDQVAVRRLLLILDDAAGHEQVRPLLPGAGGSVVLVTSRRRLTALPDTRTVDLDTLRRDEAIELLVTLADRSDLDAGDPAVGELADLCGCLPLAVGMVGRQLHHHRAWTARQLAADMTAARDRLDFMRAEDLSVTAAFDLSYRDASAGEQRLFRRLGLHPGTDFDAHVSAALDDISVATARRRLETLYDHHLLIEPEHGRYRMHDLVREHSRARATADPDEATSGAWNKLVSYYDDAVGSAARTLGWRFPEAARAGQVTQAGVSSRQDALAWLNAERLNLDAVAREAADRGQDRAVISLAASLHDFLRSQGHWDQAAGMHRLAIRSASCLGDRSAEARALARLADIQNLAGDYRAAAVSLTRTLEISEALGDKAGQADALNRLGIVEQLIGEYRAALESHQHALRLQRELGNRGGQADALNELGAVQLALADYQASYSSHSRALVIFRDLDSQVGQASALNRLGLVQRSMGDHEGAAAHHEQALRLHSELGNRPGEATALNGLALTQRAAGRYQDAIRSHERALRIYRDLGFKLGEAHALNALGATQLAAGLPEASIASHLRALRWYQDLGYRLGQAHAHNGLAQAHRASGDHQTADGSQAQARVIYREVGSRLADNLSLSPWP